MSADYKNTINLPQTDFPMRGNLPQREPKWVEKWEKDGIYQQIQAHTAQRKNMFVLHDGPPYANGPLHIGHAVNKILKDVIIKSKLLAGYRAPYIPGWDCHGLPIEVAVEKKYGKVGQKLDVREFRKKCREYAYSQIDLQRDGFKRLGVLGDWDHPYETLDPAQEADILRALAEIYANGHVTRGFKPVHWCFDCGSALAEAEIEYKDKQSPAIDIAYDALDPAALARVFDVDVPTDAIVAVPIWTTTPWTIPASLAVSVGPDFDYVLIQGKARQGKPVYLVVAASLMANVQERYGVPSAAALGQAVKGSALENIALQHPFYAERTVPVLVGDHVSAEDGTGAVHTAPGHGQEDFDVCRRYGILDQYSAQVINPVDARGVYLDGTPLFAGQHIWKANAAIIQLLDDKGRLLANASIEHSYPHCWRHKTPIAFRATPQWFISMEKENLRDTALAAIKTVRWIPSWGEDRIAAMIATRPDWCISRQRYWGVPIALFVHKQTFEPHPRSVALMEEVAKRMEKDGIDAWDAIEPSDLLPADEAGDYEKVMDVLDVWFDSGTTHQAVIEKRPELRADNADSRTIMYLEGSDQHRGWFHSSLLTSCAMHGTAPYQEVLTHGFTVDGEGKKMSKSVGNVVAPQEVMQKLGADVLRLWVASADYRHEMTVSDEILKRVADSYRRIRNTCRFLLGNLAGFDPQQHLLQVDECVALDQWAVQAAHDVQEAVIAAYTRYDFSEIVQRVQNFCTNEMGSMYLDMTKDRLYTMPTDSHGRRSAQSAMYRIAEALLRWLAPILSFTVEEAWPLMPGKRGDSVFFETWYDGLAATQNGEIERSWWHDLIHIRETVAGVLEEKRKQGDIGASLAADIVIYVDDALAERYSKAADELHFFFITSQAQIKSLEEKTAHAVRVALQDGEAWVEANPSHADKCVRCWHYLPDVGSHAEHPELCQRCIDNIDGAGEVRRWF